MAEETNGNVTVYLYDVNGSPVGMQYHAATAGEYDWQVFWYEKNLQGDVVAVYSDSGVKLVSYNYDAWGNFTTTYHNGGASTKAADNPFTYRGYYYDKDLNLYYLGTRYYDSKICRFINADKVMSGANGELNGSNLYIYCFNNPVNLTDGVGTWPEWVEKAAEFAISAAKAIGKAAVKVAVAAFESVEAQAGIGFGIGIDISNTITADISRDTYVGIDDGEAITGNLVTTEISFLDSDLSIGDTYNHLVEKGGKRVTKSGSVYDGPFAMINYPDTTRGNQISCFIFSVKENGDFVIGVSAGAHLGFGGHASIGFNVSEFLVRLFE